MTAAATILRVEDRMDSGADAPPDVDDLVAKLKARVEERRRAGGYPAGLEDDLAEHFRRVLHQRPAPRPAPDLRAPLREVQEALPLSAGRIPVDSDVPGGQALHRAISRVVGRQTEGALQQVQAFATPVQQTLDAVVSLLEELTREVRVDMVRHIDAIYERQAAQERLAARFQPPAGNGDRATFRAEEGLRRAPFHPWYSSERFEAEFRGAREEMLERYRDVAERLRGCEPVLDIGCGRGELLELLAELGVKAWGVEVDPELVKLATDRGLTVEHSDGLRSLERLDDGSLGGLVLIQVVEHLSAQETVDLVALAAAKVRPGGQVFVETVNPQSLYVYARAFYLDPTHLRPVHPAYLTFLFREAGFSSVVVDWRSPPPADEVLEEMPPNGDLPDALNANVRRLNHLLFSPQDYLLAATR